MVYKDLFGLRKPKIVNHIHSILFPRVCFGCNAQLFRGEHLLCTVCRNDLPLTEFDFTHTNMVDKVFYGRVAIEKAASFLYYRQNGIVKNLLHHLKYKNQSDISTFLGEWYGETLKEQGLSPRIDLVIPVPLHPKKLKKRGYNQVDGFAARIAAHLEAKFVADALIKTANSKTQTKKTRFLRWQQNQELYKVNPTYGLENKNILLVDDVITTGATLELCALAIKQCKGTKVYIATMAVVP